jgi:hypothetical protein
MKLRARIAQGLRWPGWRRSAPAAGSLVTHIFLGMAVFSMLAATSKPRRVVVTPPPTLEVTLVAETSPPPGRRPTPPDAPKAPPRSESKPDAADSQPIARDPRKDQKKQGAARPDIAGGKPSDDDGGVYLGDAAISDSGVPLGLRSLMEEDPCQPKPGKSPGASCGPSWSQKFASTEFQILPTEAQLRRMYPGIIPPCPYKVGCDGGEWISTNGTRSVFSERGNPMMSGAGGLGGIHETVSRLGFNPDHTDPGFGD